MNRRKIISLLLSFCMIISLLPSVALATGPGEEAAASYPVYVHGGTLQKDGMTVRSGAKFPAGTVLTVTLDESLFSGRTFAYWLGSDGTQVPQESFRRSTVMLSTSRTVDFFIRGLPQKLAKSCSPTRYSAACRIRSTSGE